MMPQQGYRDFIDRTIANYEFIRDRATPSGPYEVTQLLSSFLMVAGWPRERAIYADLEKMSVAEAQRLGFPSISIIADAPGYGVRHMADVAGFFRNAVAHGHIRLSPDPNRQYIATIQFSDQRLRDGRTQQRFSDHLTVQDVEEILYAFQSIANEIFDRATQRPA